MAEKLGISVTTPKSMPHVLGLAQAANQAGKQVEVFFTGDGVHLTQTPQFTELLEVARVGVCEVSYFTRGYPVKFLLCKLGDPVAMTYLFHKYGVPVFQIPPLCLPPETVVCREEGNEDFHSPLVIDVKQEELVRCPPWPLIHPFVGQKNGFQKYAIRHR